MSEPSSPSTAPWSQTPSGIGKRMSCTASTAATETAAATAVALLPGSRTEVLSDSCPSHGSCLVPHGERAPPGSSLGLWHQLVLLVAGLRVVVRRCCAKGQSLRGARPLSLTQREAGRDHPVSSPMSGDTVETDRAFPRRSPSTKRGTVALTDQAPADTSARPPRPRTPSSCARPTARARPRSTPWPAST